ncbi:hypothetical protein OROMI_011560 [Orobanche minor]
MTNLFAIWTDFIISELWTSKYFAYQVYMGNMLEVLAGATFLKVGAMN